MRIQPVLTVLALWLTGSVAMADHDRAEREAPLRAKYKNRITFGSQYNAYQLIPVAADAMLTGGQISSAWATNELSKAGVKTTEFLASQGYTPNDQLHTGVMKFTIWKDANILGDRVRIYTYSAYVPYLAIHRPTDGPLQPQAATEGELPKASHGMRWYFETDGDPNGDIREHKSTFIRCLNNNFGGDDPSKWRWLNGQSNGSAVDMQTPSIENGLPRQSHGMRWWLEKVDAPPNSSDTIKHGDVVFIRCLNNNYLGNNSRQWRWLNGQSNGSTVDMQTPSIENGHEFRSHGMRWLVIKENQSQPTLKGREVVFLRCLNHNFASHLMDGGSDGQTVTIQGARVP